MTEKPNPTTDSSRVESLVQKLGSSDPLERMNAREQLCSLGDLAVDGIVKALGDASRQVRWEAANCLRAIGGSKAIPALIQEMEESNTDVGWLASEALVAIGEESLIPVLKSLTSKQHQDLAHLYNHAHHIIRTFACNEKYHAVLQPLLSAFDQSEPQMGVPVRAYEVLQQLE
jgi:HEAT repeat protein